jgi:N-acetylglucosamine-6-phosphate deacetylase
MITTYRGADVHDGEELHPATALHLEDGRVLSIGGEVAADRVVNLPGGILAPGLIDLQVNGGGGEMVDGHATAATLGRICAVQARLGATGVLPTLITDTPDATAAVIAAGVAAAKMGTPGFLGLHLEGPHLDPRRRGAHDPALIRPMTSADLSRLVAAAHALPALLLTVAPESVTPAQAAALVAAGATVSLGHSDCTHAEAQAMIEAGASTVTHLFNAMSQLGNREPGLVGATLAGHSFAGLIADGIHVAPEVMRIALAARPEGIFLVSDCMALAGTDLAEFHLGGRRILRSDGRLTLEDGTLAGADLTLPQAIDVLVRRVGISVDRAIRMVTSIPAVCLGKTGGTGRLRLGDRADMVHLGASGALQAVWRGGEPVE